MTYQPKKIGDKSYIRFISKCVLNDWIVLEPIGDSDRYDCVLDRGNGFERVQVKTGRCDNKVISFPVTSCHYHTKEGQVTKNFKRTYHGQVEIFGVYCPELDKCYIIPINKTGKSSVSLRLVPQIKSNGKLVLWAKDFEI